MEKVQESNLIIIFENGTSLVLEENAVDILNDIKRQHKNFKIYKANEMDIKKESKEEKKEDKKKKIITIYFQNGIELDLEDPSDEMIAEIIEKFDNAIIIEKSNKQVTPKISPRENILSDYDMPSIFEKTNTLENTEEKKTIQTILNFTDIDSYQTKNTEKKITKKMVREALLKPGTQVGGQVLPPFALFALYHTLTE
jgi:sRNA-binding regulator protein Hfq